MPNKAYWIVHVDIGKLFANPIQERQTAAINGPNTAIERFKYRSESIPYTGCISDDVIIRVGVNMPICAGFNESLVANKGNKGKIKLE